MILGSLGASIYTGQKRNFVQPVLADDFTVLQPSGENIALSFDTSAQFSVVSLNENTVAVGLKVSKTWLTQTQDRNAEQWIAKEIIRACAVEAEKLAFQGSTAGIATVPGILGTNNGLTTCT
jgi:hypothetical protein